jgi:multiple sugar transport system substrate-binding protein
MHSRQTPKARRIRALAVVACVGTLFLSACSTAPSGGSASGSSTAKAAPGAPVGSFPGQKLTLSRWSGDPWTSQQQQQASTWSKDTGGSLAINAVPYDNLESKQALALAGPGGLDILQVQPLWFGQFAKAGYLKPLNSYMSNSKMNPPGYSASSWQKNILDLGKYKGNQYCLPDFVSSFIVAYRKDIFAKNNLAAPKTISDVEADAKALNGKDGVYGVSIPGKAAGSPVEMMSALLNGVGAWWINSAGKPALDVGKATTALTAYQNLAKYAPPGILDYHVDQIGVAAAQGKVAMAITSSPSLQGVEAAGSPTKGDWGYAPIAFDASKPAGEITYWEWCVSSKSQHPEAAYSFLQWYTDGQQQAQVAKVGWTFGGTKDFYTQPAVKSLPIYDAVSKALTNASPMPNLSDWPQAQDAVQTIIQKVITNQMTPAQGASAMSASLKSTLG